MLEEIKQGMLVKIKWDDITGHQGWKKVTDDFYTLAVVSLGWVCSVCPERVTISAHVCEEENIVIDPLSIPAGTITSIEEIELED